jgi:hypothetical protein
MNKFMGLSQNQDVRIFASGSSALIPTGDDVHHYIQKNEMFLKSIPVEDSRVVLYKSGSASHFIPFRNSPTISVSSASLSQYGS